MEGRQSRDTLLRLTDELYAGIAEPEGFTPFARSLKTALGATYTGFVIRTPEGQEVVCHGDDATFLADYRGHFHTVDPYCQAILRLRPGECSNTEAVIPRSKMRHTEFYSDFLKPRRLESSLAGVIEHTDGRANVVSSFFDHDRGPAHNACEIVAKLLPHIRRASRVRAQLARTPQHPALAEQLLNQFTCAALVVTRDSRLLMANAPGEAILTRRDGVYLDRLEVRAVAMQDRRHLSREVAFAGDARSAGVIRLQRQAPGSALFALVSPLLARESPGERAVLVLLRKPEHSDPPKPLVVAKGLGLTLAEARVAAMVASGLVVKEVAAHLGVSEHTARNQLKSAMRKAGASRQVELVRLVNLLQR